MQISIIKQTENIFKEDQGQTDSKQYNNIVLQWYYYDNGSGGSDGEYSQYTFSSFTLRPGAGGEYFFNGWLFYSW